MRVNGVRLITKWGNFYPLSFQGNPVFIRLFRNLPFLYLTNIKVVNGISILIKLIIFTSQLIIIKF
jgi:hypothetical protein